MSERLSLGVRLSTARIPAVLVALVGSLLVFIEPSQNSRWVGYFPDTGMYLSVFSYAVGGSLFALSGYHTMALRVVRAPELARSVRSPDDVLALRAAGDLVWLWGALLVVHSAAYLRTGLYASAFSLSWWSLSLLGFAAATLCYSLGVALGALLRIPWMQFVVTLLPYALTLLAGDVALSGAYRFQHLIGPFVDQSWGSAFLPNHLPIVTLAVYSGATAATLFFGSLFFAARGDEAIRTGIRCGAGLFAMVVAGGAMVLFFPGTTFYVPRTSGWSCSTSGDVCGWITPGSVGVATLEIAYANVERAFGDATPPSLRFAERNVPVSGDYLTLDMPPGHPGAAQVATAMLPSFVDAVTAPRCGDSREGIRVRAEVTDMLLARLNDVADDDSSAATGLEALLDACRTS